MLSGMNILACLLLKHGAWKSPILNHNLYCR